MKRRTRGITRGFAILLLAYGFSAWHLVQRSLRQHEHEPAVVVRFVHWQLESGMREAFDVMAKRYMQLHPDVRIEQFAIPGNVYRQWVRTQLASDDVPDLVCINALDQAEIAQIPRHFQPITTWVNEPNPYNRGTPLEGKAWRDTFIDGNRNRSTYIEAFRNYYAVGLSSHTMRIFYNQDMLQAVTGSDATPQTFREWLTLGEKIRAHRPGLIHVAGAQDNVRWLMPTLVNQSLTRWLARSDHGMRFATTNLDFFGDLIDGAWDLRSPPAQTALRIMSAFGAEMSPGFLQLSRDSAMRAFLRGEAFSLPNGTWDYPTMRATAGFRIGAFRLPLPAMDDPDFGGYAMTPASDGGVTSAFPFYLTRRSRHPEAAIDFLRFLTSYDGNARFSRESHWMPSVIGVPVEPELRPFRQNNEGYLMTSGQNSPIFSAGPGEEYLQLFEKNLHVLYSPGGGVEAYTRVLEKSIRAVTRRDLQRELRIESENLRRRDVALAALHELGGDDAAQGDREQAGLHLSEIQIYLMQEKLHSGGNPG